MTQSINIAERLTRMAHDAPFRRAVVQPAGLDRWGRYRYRQATFSQLDEFSDRIAGELIRRGLRPGLKLVLFVPFGIEFIALTFALFKAGAVIVLIDPGMGRTNIFKCLEEVRPDGFVAIPRVHVVRWLSAGKFPTAKFNVCVGPRLPGVIATYRELLDATGVPVPRVHTAATDPAAVIFTSGSTGPPKGVLYEHGMFDAQVELIRDFYGIEPGEIDLPGFPLFGLFNAAMGVTTVIPDMDPTKPAQVNPEKILAAIRDQGVTQAFGSPAFWNRVGRYCDQRGIQLPSLKRALSAGGPVPVHVLDRMSRVLIPPADLHTPYGATESLPVASINGRDVLTSTAEKTRAGKGTCVGRRFPGVDVKIIEETEGPIASLGEAKELPAGSIGEIIVSGPSVTREYFQRPEATRLAKIPDGDRFWHRIGDVGYLDEEGLLWFCGRKSHIVQVGGEKLYSVCCEAIFDTHPQVYRSALIGVGSPADRQPAIVIEPEEGAFPVSPPARERFADELRKIASGHAQTQGIKIVLFHRSLPVDTRHNVKINREALAVWAEKELRKRPSMWLPRRISPTADGFHR